MLLNVLISFNVFELYYHKFRKPMNHVSVDLAMIIRSKDIYKATRLLHEKKFKVIVDEPYTMTLARRGFIVDLYTWPSFARIMKYLMKRKNIGTMILKRIKCY